MNFLKNHLHVYSWITFTKTSSVLHSEAFSIFCSVPPFQCHRTLWSYGDKYRYCSNTLQQKRQEASHVTKTSNIFSFLGKIFCHKVQPSNGIIPTRIEVKEFQSEDDKPDQDQKEQETKQPEVNNNPSKEEPLCYCWKDAARILDKTFSVFYSTSVFIQSVIQAYLLQDHEYPPKRCS